MNKNNRRSSLRKAPCNEDETTTTAMKIKRRISFSGKKSIREFVNTEEPKNWDNSYEVSDHLNVEDSSGSGSGSVSVTRSHTHTLNGEDKENIALPTASICERSHIDITLNLQTSVDVTLLPCELARKQQQKSLDSVRDSLAMTLDERQRLQDTLYDRGTMDKTLDLMSGSLVARLQKSVLHNASGGGGGDCPPQHAPIVERKYSIHTTANCMSDSFMDITPLAYVAPNPAPTTAAAAPASHRERQPEDIELDMFDDPPQLRTNEKENVHPAQKSLFMELAEEPGKQIKNKTQHEPVDISFSCSLNVSSDKDLVAPANISFESASSANSTINFKDESVLIPLDMLSGKHISKKLNLRQLNEELEAGKIQLFPNGPKTPTTDRKNPKKRFWYMGQEGTNEEEECPSRDLRSSIKPRAMLNFSESMAMSPQPIMASLHKEEKVKAKDKERDKDKDDKRKYRFSQADEMMLDNTNFLAHARLGDETQSRNTSKNSTRRETTYDYPELDLERPTSRHDFHPPMHSSRPRQTIHQPEEMEADQSLAFSAISAMKATAPPPRRTLYMNESIDQEVTDEQRQKDKRAEIQAPAFASKRITRRETLVLQVSMEEEIIPPPKAPHSNSNALPVEKEGSKPRPTLQRAEALDKENVGPENVKISALLENPSKSRQNVLLDEAMEEEMNFSMKAPPVDHQKATKSRQTLLMAEPIEEAEQRSPANEPSSFYPSYKSRKTITMSEAIEEDKSILQPREQSLLKYKVFEPPQRPKSRHTLLMAEPIEEDQPAALEPSNPIEDKSRLRPRNTILMAEPISEDLGCNSTRQQKSMQQTLGRSESKVSSKINVAQPEDMDQELAFERPPNREVFRHPLPSSKPRQTIHQPEEMQQDLSEFPAAITTVKTSLPRRTVYMNESIEQEVVKAKPVSEDIEERQVEKVTPKAMAPTSFKTKRRETILMQESMEEDMISPLKEQNFVSMEKDKSKARHTLHMAEPLEVEKDQRPTKKDLHSKASAIPKRLLKSRQTIVLDEPLEEEIDSTRSKSTEKPSSIYSYSKAEKTIIESKPIGEDRTVTDAKPRQTLLLEEPIETKMRSKGNESSKLSKSRKTLIKPEPIEEDDFVPLSREQSQPKLHRHTLYLEEPIEEEVRSKEKDQTNFYQPSRSRKTLIQAEPIEEDEVVPNPKEQSLPKPPRHTLYLEEPIEEEVRPRALNQTSEYRKTFINTEPTKEKVNSYENDSYQPSQPRKTIIKSEPMEDEPSLAKYNTTEASLARYGQQKSRQTLVMAEPIEEDQQVGFKSEDLPSQEEQQPHRKSRNTISMADSIIEDLGVKFINKSVSLEYQSPQETIQNEDLKIITPMPNPRLTSLYKGVGNFTPGMSLTEFEDQEEMCKTPLPKAAKQKQRSIYQATKMELMDASAFGTPVSHVNHKRLPMHLTPNLPESKKRHTQLFADSQMEMDVEMEDGAWEGENMELGTHSFRPNFKIDHFDETVQPVRDYRPTLGPLVQDNVLKLPQPSELEEKPITISDVTNYFQQEKQEEQRKSSSDRESCSNTDHTFKSYAVTNTKFINLSGDTTIFAGVVNVDKEEDEMAPQNQLDNEEISLVSTLAEETDVYEQVEQPDPQTELCQAQLTPFAIAGSSASCRKCRNCNRSLSETRLSDSFVLPEQRLFEFTKERQRLRRLRLKPSFEEMQKHWEMKSLEVLNESLEETTVEERLFHWDKAKLMQKLKRPQSRRNRGKAPDRTRESFFDRLDRLLAEQQPNWIFDYQLKLSRKMIFYHRLLTTFRLVVTYKVLDEQDESTIRVCSITEDNEVAFGAGVPERLTAFEHYLNFQLSLKMPLNLTDAIGGSDEESFLKFLHRIDQIVVDIKGTFHKLMTLLAANNSRLLRQSNRMFVRKTVVKCIENEPLIRFERIHFQVQVYNVEEICFSDIQQPELYLFNENLQFLPKGIAFLEAFLPNPEQYLKT